MNAYTSSMTTGYGVDVSATRIDDLDKKLLAELKVHPEASVLDLGCGAGGFAARLATDTIPATYLGIDQHDFSVSFQPAVVGQTFTQGDFILVKKIIGGDHFKYCLCQRSIHYATYVDATRLLRYLSKWVSHLYISFSGLQSAIGGHYVHRDRKIEKRFGMLDAKGQGLFHIDKPLCLYTPEEVRVLLEKNGWLIEELWVSAFQNIKVVARAQPVTAL